MMFKLKNLATFLMVCLGSWFCVQALAPMIQGFIGGGWIVMLIIGAALILGAWYLRR